jgi:hypothetical protein
MLLRCTRVILIEGGVCKLRTTNVIMSHLIYVLDIETNTILTSILLELHCL